MAKGKQAILLSWVAVNNDPYERERSTGDFRRIDGKLTPGPTLTLLFDPDSPYKGVIGDVVFFHRSADDDSRESRALPETVAAIRQQCPEVRVSDVSWKGGDPTDHQDIYRFLRKELPALRERFSGYGSNRMEDDGTGEPSRRSDSIHGVALLAGQFPQDLGYPHPPAQGAVTSKRIGLQITNDIVYCNP